MNPRPLLYLETSVFGFYYDRHARNVDRRQAVIRLLRQIDEGIFSAVTSPLTVREFNRAPPRVRDSLVGLLTSVRIIEPDDAEVERLTALYVREGAIPEDYDDDARHVAYATLSASEILVSLNLTHIANEWAERSLNAINLREGFRMLSVRTPEEVIKYEV